MDLRMILAIHTDSALRYLARIPPAIFRRFCFSARNCAERLLNHVCFLKRQHEELFALFPPLRRPRLDSPGLCDRRRREQREE